MIRKHLIPAFAAAILALPLAAQDIGTVASLDPTLQGTPPGGGARTLAVGSPVVAGEVMATGPAGRAQLLFLDQTTLSLAPSSRIVLDSFVYDPNGGGNVGIQLTTGALRFVGGKATEDEAATITTPSATIGVRGSSTLVLFRDGQTIAVFIAGERLCITPAGGARTCTSRRGGVLTDAGYQGRVNPDFLEQLLTLIDGAPRPGTNAGAPTGVGPDNPPDRQPVSTTGEEPDTGIFDDPIREDTDAGIFGRGEYDEGNFPNEGYSFEDCFLSFTGQSVDSWTSELPLSEAFVFFPGLGEACPVN